jgi:hypothetical protein
MPNRAAIEAGVSSVWEEASNTTEDYSFTPYVPVGNALNSNSRLIGIADEVLNLSASELPGADSLIAAGIWPERDQVVIQATAVTSQLRLALAQRYGISAVTIWLNPNATQLTSAVDSRDNDNDDWVNSGSHYDANSGACTTGFAWGTATNSYMITAGHCMPRNGTGVSTIGSLTGTAPNSHGYPRCH